MTEIVEIAPTVPLYGFAIPGQGSFGNGAGVVACSIRPRSFALGLNGEEAIGVALHRPAQGDGCVRVGPGGEGQRP